MPISLESVELREQSRLFTRAAVMETRADVKHVLSGHAVALTQRADDLERGAIAAKRRH
jgi:hypothetical protein